MFNYTLQIATSFPNLEFEEVHEWEWTPSPPPTYRIQNQKHRMENKFKHIVYALKNYCTFKSTVMQIIWLQIYDRFNTNDKH